MDEEWEELFDEVYRQFIVPNKVSTRPDTLKKRAADAHPLLIELAKEGSPGDEKKLTGNRPTTKYGNLAEQIDSNSGYIWKVLVTIDKIGARRGDPPVSPLVETARTVGPGHGYFKWTHLSTAAIEIPEDKPGLTDEQKAEWQRKLREVYEHDDWYWSE